MSETDPIMRLQHMDGSQVTTIAVRVAAADSLEAVYLAHRDAVFRYLSAITGDEDSALDLTAATFERALGELRRGREIGLGWLLRTARNAAIDADRRARTGALFMLRARPTPPLAVSAEDLSIEAERARRVHAAVLNLPDPQREAIALRYTTTLSVREIGEVIGKHQAATQKLIERGLVRLKEDLDDLE
jgi:RNA polymerase sigma-70 factor, ECF subfamily